MVPVDFSDSSVAALARAAGMAVEMNAAVDILHVWPEEAAPSGDREQPPAARLALARAALAMEDLRLSILRRAVHASRIRIAYGAAAEAIVRVSREGYDLIVMGWHHAAEDSHADCIVDRVAAEAPCPVLTVDVDRATAAAEPAP